MRYVAGLYFSSVQREEGLVHLRCSVGSNFGCFCEEDKPCVGPFACMEGKEIGLKTMQWFPLSLSFFFNFSFHSFFIIFIFLKVKITTLYFLFVFLKFFNSTINFKIKNTHFFTIFP